jgi:hypothetical protein
MTTSDAAPDILARAQALRAKVCSETHCWVRLDVLEGLIDEITVLRAVGPRRPPAASVADIVNKAKEGKP